MQLQMFSSCNVDPCCNHLPCKQVALYYIIQNTTIYYFLALLMLDLTLKLLTIRTKVPKHMNKYAVL